MMKKNGFTLAEVLITLAIIGVVATMTLPALMNNTNEQQARTGLKKAINTLTEAAQMHQATEGTDFSSITGYGNAQEDAQEDVNMNTLFQLLDSRLSVDLARTTGTPVIVNGTAQQSIPTAEAFAGQTVYLRDGSAIIIPDSDATLPEDAGNQAVDGLPVGFVVVYDTNGLKAPNVLSNCKGLTNNSDVDDETPPAENGDMGQIDTADCTKADRVIKDQFQIRLRGTIAQPEGAAAAWAYDR